MRRLLALCSAVTMAVLLVQAMPSAALAAGGVVELGGATRYETAAEQALHSHPSSEWVIVASGENYVDSLAASGLAGALDCPIVLTNRTSVPQVTLDAIRSMGASKIIILGQTAAVSSSVESTLRQYGSVTRLGGATRYATQELNGSFSMILMVCTAAAIVSYLPVGYIAARIGRKKTILLGVAMLAVSFFAASFFHSVTPLLYVFFVLAGMGWAFINVNSYPMVVEISRLGSVGKYTGYYYTFSMAAQIVTPIVSGALLEHVGYFTLFPYAALCVALSFLTMLFTRHGDNRPQRQGNLEAYADM